MRSGVAGDMSVDSRQISVRRGYTPLEGVTAGTHSATYFWSPVGYHNYTLLLFILVDLLRHER